MHKKYLINTLDTEQVPDVDKSVDTYNDIIYAYIKLKKQVRVLHKKNYLDDYNRQLWKIDKTIRYIRELKRDKYVWGLFKQNVDCKYFECDLKRLGRKV